jgi:hypothetical protein
VTLEYESNDIILSADIGHSLRLGSKPYFHHDMFPREVVESLIEQHGLGDGVLKVVKDAGNLTDGLRKIFCDLVNVSSILERRLVKFDPFAFQQILISVLYRLLHLYTMNESVPGSQNERLCYFGLLVLMSTTIFQPGRKEPLQYELLAEKLSHALMEPSSTDTIDETMIFWILYIGGISVLRNDNLTWLMPWMKTTASSLGIKDWSEAREVLCRYPWIDVFHDAPAQKLWNQIHDISISSILPA